VDTAEIGRVQDRRVDHQRAAMIVRRHRQPDAIGAFKRETGADRDPFAAGVLICKRRHLAHRTRRSIDQKRAVARDPQPPRAA